tara:strand:- start:192 stop:359 length:168 start_codon:yes stop_codon:yes gene_type:complete
MERIVAIQPNILRLTARESNILLVSVATVTAPPEVTTVPLDAAVQRSTTQSTVSS